LVALVAAVAVVVVLVVVGTARPRLGRCGGVRCSLRSSRRALASCFRASSAG
jgi:hypothetical protein